MFLTGFITGLIIGGSIEAALFIRDYRIIDKDYKESMTRQNKKPDQND